jgi:hypothetical protein
MPAEKTPAMVAAEIDAAMTARKRADAEGTQLDKMLKAIDALADAVRTQHSDTCARLDALEEGAHPGSGKHLPMHGSRHRGATVIDGEPGAPTPVVADSLLQAAAPLLQKQSDADQAYRAWGLQAPPPMLGEKLHGYRLRLLQPHKKHSKQFAHAEIDNTDGELLDEIERTILSDSVVASRDAATVLPDQLREIRKFDHAGRVITEFVGQPRVWMSQFSGNRRRLVGIKTASPS